MSTAKRIARNTGFLFLSNLVQKFLSLFLIIYLSHQLGLADFGVYSFVWSFVILFTIFSELGVGPLIFREIAKRPEKAGTLFGDALGIKPILSGFVFVIAFSFLAVMHWLNPAQYPLIIVVLVLLAVFSMLLDSLAGLFRMVFMALERMEFDFYANTVYKALLLALSFLVLFLGFGLIELFLVAIFASLINALFSIYFVLKRFVRPQISFNFVRYKQMLFMALPFAFMALFMSIYGNIDIAMLSFLKNNVAVAYYSAAVRLVNTLAFLPATFTSAVFPVMSSFFAKQNQSLKTVVEKSASYLLILIVPIVFGTTLLAYRIIDLIYPTVQGNDFGPAAWALQILIWFSLLSFVNFVFINVLQSTAYEKKISLIIGLTVALNIVLNLFLIPAYSFTGAAWATVCSELVLLVCAYYVTCKQIHRVNLLKVFLKPALAALIMSAFIYLFFFLNLFLLVALSAVIYFMVLVLLKGFDSTDVGILKKVLNLA